MLSKIVMAPSRCILCQKSGVKFFFKDMSKNDGRRYYFCEDCQLIFVAKSDLPSLNEELQRYNHHENTPDDHQYRAFLGKLFKPMHEHISGHSKGLDFGSGPGPTLHLMFEEEGHNMNIFDPFYANDPGVFDESYDFITATEVAEHLHHPAKEFERLWSCLNPGGYLGIMTKRPKLDHSFFADWHYRLDNTHVTFYTSETFRWMAEKWAASVIFFGNSVVIFQKEA